MEAGQARSSSEGAQAWGAGGMKAQPAEGVGESPVLRGAGFQKEGKGAGRRAEWGEELKSYQYGCFSSFVSKSPNLTKEMRHTHIHTHTYREDTKDI